MIPQACSTQPELDCSTQPLELIEARIMSLYAALSLVSWYASQSKQQVLSMQADSHIPHMYGSVASTKAL